jgi:hypothetical protein
LKDLKGGDTSGRSRNFEKEGDTPEGGRAPLKIAKIYGILGLKS